MPTETYEHEGQLFEWNRDKNLSNSDVLPPPNALRCLRWGLLGNSRPTAGYLPSYPHASHGSER